VIEVPNIHYLHRKFDGGATYHVFGKKVQLTTFSSFELVAQW
jgi:hypothetical protein